MESKKLILDYSKWRAGGNLQEPTWKQLGIGNTELHNKEGFECCIGQFLLQCDATIEDIQDVGEPLDLGRYFPPFNKTAGTTSFVNSKLSNDLIRVNDDPFSTPEQKILEISSLLKNEGIELDVINCPPTTE